MTRDYKYVHFTPWIGKYYGRGGFKGVRLLVLGESCYVWYDGAGKKHRPGCHFRKTIQGQITGRADTKKFWTNIAAAFLGHKPEQDEKGEFWDRVMFYNYVQTHLPGPRKEPTPRQWRAARPAFKEILERHKPQLIVALGQRRGRRLWNHMPDTSWYRASRLPTARVYYIRHPSFAFSWREWHPKLLRAIRRAR